MYKFLRVLVGLGGAAIAITILDLIDSSFLQDLKIKAIQSDQAEIMQELGMIPTVEDEVIGEPMKIVPFRMEEDYNE